MSHISKIEVEIDSLECLQRACAFLGFKFVRNQSTYKWYGRVVNPQDHPLPEGMGMDQLGKCDHAIKVPEADYEIGVVKHNGKYVLLLDYWDSKLRLRVGEKGGRVKQAYAIERIKMEAQKRKYHVSAVMIENGIRLMLAA